MLRNLTAAVTAVMFFVAASSVNASVIEIVNEDFVGAGLNGSTAIVDSAVIAAGGTATWDANANFLADGSFASQGGENTSAHLTLGEYINNTKGTADGLFTLTATIQRTGGQWFSVGFSSLDDPDINNHFLNANNNTGTIIQRNNNAFDVFTLGNTSLTDIPGFPGARTVSIELDLRDHNGIDDFGTARYFDSQQATALATFNYASDTDFQSIIISGPANAAGTISNLTLTQAVAAIPEPSSLTVLGLGSLLVMRRRRK